jgi:predicted RNA polymerase sigma factor
LTKAQTAKFLNMGMHDIPVLVRAGLLKPLGHPNDSNQKYFATADLVADAENREWLVQVCDVLYKHWYKMNAAKRRKSGQPVPDDAD